MDELKGLILRIYADADVAGDGPEHTSTSGAFLCLIGDNTFYPLSAKVTKQTAIAHSTPEAEITSANEAIRRIGLPALDLWEQVAKRKVALTLIEDNESTVAIIKSGRNPTMRHISRTQGVNIGWLHDLYDKKLFSMIYSRTESMCADVFTKTFKDLPKWQLAYRMIGIRKPGDMPEMPPEVGARPPKPESSTTKASTSKSSKRVKPNKSR